MPRGRPRKKVIEPFKLVDKVEGQNNAPKCQNDTLDGTLDETLNEALDEAKESSTESTKGRKSNSKQNSLCTRCGKPITTTTPFRVNLAYLTSVASYHRNVAEDVPTLCNECAKGLSDAVDRYLISGGAKSKFERE